jgi:hypothetical protein
MKEKFQSQAELYSISELRDLKEKNLKLEAYEKYLKELKNEDLQYEIGYLLSQFSSHRLDLEHFEKAMMLFDQIEGRTEIGELKEQIKEMRQVLINQVGQLKDFYVQ